MAAERPALAVRPCGHPPLLSLFGQARRQRIGREIPVKGILARFDASPRKLL
jgi:hypothetical protein